MRAHNDAARVPPYAGTEAFANVPVRGSVRVIGVADRIFTGDWARRYSLATGKRIEKRVVAGVPDAD